MEGDGLRGRRVQAQTPSGAEGIATSKIAHRYRPCSRIRGRGIACYMTLSLLLAYALRAGGTLNAPYRRYICHLLTELLNRETVNKLCPILVKDTQREGV